MHTLPGTEIHTLAPPDELAFFHRAETQLPRPVTALDAWNIARQHQIPGLKLAMQVRDAISQRFGVRPIRGFSTAPAQEVTIGTKIDFFTVEFISQNTLTLSAPDKHLNVFLCINVDGNTLSATSSVITRNLFGRVYMLPVAPAHKLITAYTLRQVRKALESEPNLPMDAAPGPG